LDELGLVYVSWKGWGRVLILKKRY
jgi:hypothetical protein